MRTLRELIENNRAWAQAVAEGDSDFFAKSAGGQAPPYLWIGCSDSRVPANEIVGLHPGELFVHRNIANLVSPSDLNCQSVLQFAVDVLKIKHVIVCGHTKCGGVEAALRRQRLGLVDRWLRDVEDVMFRHESALATLEDDAARWSMLCALNTIEQAVNVCRSPAVQEAWLRHQPLEVHGWVYDVCTGLLRDLDFCVTHPRELKPLYARALEEALASSRIQTR